MRDSVNPPPLSAYAVSYHTLKAHNKSEQVRSRPGYSRLRSIRLRQPSPARLTSWLLALLAFSLPIVALADNVELFAQARSGLFVIQVTDANSDRKVSLGSGFLMENGLIATNYHVVSRQLLHPESYSLAYEGEDGQRGELQVAAVDAVHDLALVRASEDELRQLYRFPLAGELPEQGASVISLGNPFDVGISVVPGTYNGAVARSYQKRLHFTGALNPGMSGGPAVNESGEVVGINVAGAGNSVSFLVPVEHLQTLIARTDPSVEQSYAQIRASIQQDLVDYQATLIDSLLAGDWSLKPFGPIQVPGELTDYVNCVGGGSSEDDDLPYEQHTIDCTVRDRVYLSDYFSTGMLELDYSWFETEELSQLQFYNLLSGLNYLPMNPGTKDDVTQFQCHEDMMDLDSLPGESFKAVYCVRAYLDYAGLTDVLFVATSLRGGDHAFSIHYTLAGVTQDRATAFNQAFVRALAWK